MYPKGAFGDSMIKIEQKILNGYNFIDLFAGLGGFRLALESLGAQCVYSNEWDRHAQDVYQKNFGERPDGDITKVDEKAIPEHDIICAGFPCQAFSISGKQRGFEDSRGTLFFDVARIVKEKRPKVVFMENVKNFASHDSGRTLEVVEGTMKELGYTVNHQVLNAAHYGVPQKRERIYIVCFDETLPNTNFSFPEKEKLRKRVADLLLPSEDSTLDDLWVSRKDFLPVKQTTRNTVEDGNGENDGIDDSDSVPTKTIRVGVVNKGGQGERIYDPNGVGITLSAHGGGVFAKTGGYLINKKMRKLHPRECARLMGFPDTYQLGDKTSQTYKQFGNSVVVDVIQKIGWEIGTTLTEQNNKREQ